MTAYATIIADPPWKFGDPLPGKHRGAGKHYQLMETRDIAAYLTAANIEVAQDARLFLWRVAALQRDAIDVLEAWGFSLKAELVWRKLTVHGKPWFGMGRQVRMGHEVCLVGTKGRPPVLNHSTRSVFEAPFTGHSVKPVVFYSIVEELSPGPYLELFARQRRLGWDALGDEVPDR